MRFLTILLLVTLSYFSAEALKKRQLQQDHAGYCPMHRTVCNIYCSSVLDELIARREINGCTRDNQCASNEKCCQPACGCNNKCTEALEKPGFEKFA